MQKDRFPVVLVLDNIRSLQNIGAMFRTAEAANISKIYLTGICGQPPRKEITKAALGADGVLPWEYCKSSVDLIADLKKQGFLLYPQNYQIKVLISERLNISFLWLWLWDTREKV